MDGLLDSVLDHFCSYCVTFSPFCKGQTEAKLHISPTKCCVVLCIHLVVAYYADPMYAYCLTECWPGPVDTGCRQVGQSIPGARHAVGGVFVRLKVIQYIIRCIIIINIKKLRNKA